MSFEFDFNEVQLANILPTNKHIQEWYDALCKELPKYDITTPKRVAMFIAQTAHESAGFTALTENLNYRAKSLTAIWPKRFPPDVAAKYERKPEMIANRAYCDRMGNGPEASGDGWKFHGRGLIQLTGKSNYVAFAKEIDMDLDECVQYCETPEGAVESACFFWSHHNLNAISDAGDVLKATKVINGGTLGLADREKHYHHALEIFEE